MIDTFLTQDKKNRNILHNNFILRSSNKILPNFSEIKNLNVNRL